MKSRHTAHVALNVLGTVLPMLAGVLVVPGLLQMLGTERFGMLALAWVLVSGDIHCTASMRLPKAVMMSATILSAQALVSGLKCRST